MKQNPMKMIYYSPECGPMDFYAESAAICASGGTYPEWPEENIIP